MVIKYLLTHGEPNEFCNVKSRGGGKLPPPSIITIRPDRNMILVSTPMFSGVIFSMVPLPKKIHRAVLSEFKMADVKTEIQLYHRVQGVVLGI